MEITTQVWEIGCVLFTYSFIFIGPAGFNKDRCVHISWDFFFFSNFLCIKMSETKYYSHL